VLLKYVGLNPIVVHGGGPEITGYMERLGLPVEFVGGLRVSDANTVEVAKMVLVGKVNKEIVLRVNRHGQPAVGLCGDDGSLFHVSRRSAPGGEDIGFVGRSSASNVGVIEHIARDYIPVIASVGADRDGNSYNVNADEAAGAVAGALGAYKVVFLTDVPGWLRDPADPDSLIGQASAERGEARALAGLEGGMRPKLEACVDAIDERRQRRPHPRRADRTLAAARAVHRRWDRHEDRDSAVSLAELQALERDNVIPPTRACPSSSCAARARGCGTRRQRVPRLPLRHLGHEPRALPSGGSSRRCASRPGG
jgi:acetylglutamate kinase